MGKKKPVRTERPATRLGDIERFRGMSEERVARITLEEHHAYQPVMMAVESIHRTVTALQQLAESNDAPHWSTRAILERGLAHAMARSAVGTAECWYDALIATYSPDAQERRALRERFRAFLIGACAARALRRRGFTVSPEERLVMARSAFRSGDQHRAEDRDEYFAASVACGDTDDVMQILADAILRGDDVFATRAARALGRALRKQELVRLADAKLSDRTADPERVASFLQRHALFKHQFPHLEQCIAADLPYATVTAVARRMRMKLTANQLSRMRERRKLECHIDDAFAITRVLARRNPKRFGSEQRTLHEWARDVELTQYDSITRAEMHGQRCGEPLTCDELYEFLEQHGTDVRYTEDCDAALALIAQHIATLLRA